MEEVRSDRIVLDSYAEVLKRDQTFTIVVRSLPEGYQKKDLVYSSENEKIGASLHLVGTTTPGATVKFEIVHKLSIIGGLGVKDVKRLEVIANSDGQFDTQVNMSDVTSGAAITVNGEVYVDGTKVASITRNAVRE